MCKKTGKQGQPTKLIRVLHIVVLTPHTPHLPCLVREMVNIGFAGRLGRSWGTPLIFFMFFFFFPMSYTSRQCVFVLGISSQRAKGTSDARERFNYVKPRATRGVSRCNSCICKPRCGRNHSFTVDVVRTHRFWVMPHHGHRHERRSV